ncbi:MAG: hypothetical protein CVU08_12760 [Bacteroidetes bacterium HGW-Bacteroidetes-3]|nr:MAG: hypothetical protein CVU08_12760 [Bacteroidetes bacterium HGW-Bacteroidetes-3]
MANRPRQNVKRNYKRLKVILDFLNLILIIVLFLVLYQDFKKRTIHIILPILIFITSLIINYFSVELSFILILNNFIFILINIVGLVLYFSFKSKEFVNPIDKLIGLGDVVFFFSLTPLFNLKPFIIFFIFGLLFSLIAHYIFILFKNIESIPLAGYLALFLIINFFLQYTFNTNFLF